MRIFTLLSVLIFGLQARSQELFVMTEPASNMPTGSIGTRVGQSLMKEKDGDGYNYKLIPEVMWGISKNWMVHANFFVSNGGGQINIDGGSLYAKYRFFSVDDFHSHFRMAAFGRYSLNNRPMPQEEIDVDGNNSGFETGIVATQLINKLAISSSISYEKSENSLLNSNFAKKQNESAINYTLSFGRLMHPNKYSNYKQTNINLMSEFLGQRLNDTGKSYLDFVPSVQFIINSQAAINLAYKQQVYSTMDRFAPNGVYLKLEYTFFNVTQ
jgi:hypothetical protein